MAVNGDIYDNAGSGGVSEYTEAHSGVTNTALATRQLLTTAAANDNFDMTALSNDANRIHISTSFLKKNGALASINGPQKVRHGHRMEILFIRFDS